MFKEFWTVYPKKTMKSDAEKLFNKIDEQLQKIIITDVIDRTNNHAQWRNKEFIPNPARYLRRCLYNDEIIRPKTKEMAQAENESLRHPVHSRLWTMLIQMYGNKFIASYGETMPKAWLYGLNDLTEKQCSRILRHLSTDSSEFIPDLPKIIRIRNIGKDLRVYTHKQIGNPAKPETVEKALEEMKRTLRTASYKTE